jgi:hypothetical protein
MAELSDNAAKEFEAGKAVVDALKGHSTESQSRILRWVGELLGLTLAAPASASPPSPSSDPAPTTVESSQARPGSTVDIASFVKEKSPTTDVQFATATAYYYGFAAPRGLQKIVIDTDSVVDAARLANRDRLSKKQALKALNNAKRKGYLDSVGRGQFTINAVGENLVARFLPLARGRTSESRIPRRKQAKAQRTSSKRR